MNKLAIIGGGASGLFAGIIAKYNNPQMQVVIYERLPRVGKKLLTTGNGRCNLTNCDACKTDNDKPLFYHGQNPEFVLPAFDVCDTEKLCNIFEKMGLLVVNEGNKIFPMSLQAGSVLDVLRLTCEKVGVEIKTECTVSDIKPINNGFLLNGDFYNKVIVATGGKSSPHLGSDGSGYELLKKLGHTVSPLHPAITQIKTDTTYVKQLKGIKWDALASIKVGGKVKRAEFGEILFCDYGLSGPPILQLSRIASVENNAEITLDLMPDFNDNQLYNIIAKLKETLKDDLCENLLIGIINKRLGQVCIKYAGININEKIATLSNEKIKRIAFAMKNLTFKVTGVQGFANAQVTAGGVLTKDFNPETMESKLHNGLYTTGEVLDIDGDCGGFNLQWAFSSGYLAGKCASGGAL